MAINDRSRRDAAGVGPTIRPRVRLVPLHDRPELEIAEGEPDVRGWPVQTISGRQIGTVEELLVDPDNDEIVMLQIDLPGTGRHSFAPIRAAQFDRERRAVLIDSAELQSDADMPSLTREGQLSDDEVRTFGERYDRAYGERGWSDTRDYGIKRGDDEVRFARRAPDTSDAAVDSAAIAAAASDARIGEARLADREVALERQREAESAEARSEERRAGDRRLRYDSPSKDPNRPLVVEEVVVRRRTIDPATGEVLEENR